MTEHWRSRHVSETAMQKFFRGRWQYGSVYVIDIDHVICRADGLDGGLLVEEKHVNAEEQSARITRTIARRLGWWAARFVYHTDDGTPYGEVTRIDAVFWDPQGRESSVDEMGFDSFDEWIAERFGAVAT